MTSLLSGFGFRAHGFTYKRGKSQACMHMDAALHDAKSESCVYARVSVCIYHYDFIGLRMSSFFQSLAQPLHGQV